MQVQVQNPKIPLSAQSIEDDLLGLGGLSTSRQRRTGHLRFFLFTQPCSLPRRMFSLERLVGDLFLRSGSGHGRSNGRRFCSGPGRVRPGLSTSPALIAHGALAPFASGLGTLPSLVLQELSSLIRLGRTFCRLGGLLDVICTRTVFLLGDPMKLDNISQGIPSRLGDC